MLNFFFKLEKKIENSGCKFRWYQSRAENVGSYDLEKSPFQCNEPHRNSHF